MEHVIKLAVAMWLLLIWGVDVHGQGIWNTPLESTTSWSSPRLADLNGDSILDVVLGLGGDGAPNPAAFDFGYGAFDGLDGDTLWTVEARSQVYTRPTLIDINSDGTLDVIIGGRFAEMQAINGLTGEVIWDFFPYEEPVLAADSGWYNFYSCQLIPDQNNDGIQDLLTANGGYGLAPPNDPNRPPGNLLIISSVDGTVIAKAQVPDDAETYCSPLVTRFGDDTLRVVFGTGGETLPGGLWRCKLSDVLNENLSGSELLHFSNSKGYIAPPSLADLNGDNVLDIIANSHDSRLIAVDGVTGSLIWEKVVHNAESNVNPAIGYLNQDVIPDVVTTFALGEFPQYSGFIRFLIDGSDGSVIDSVALPQVDYSSVVLVDVNADGYDEAISVITRPDFSGIQPIYYVELTIDDVVNGTVIYDTTFYGSAPMVTPVVGDMDNNGLLDIAFGYNSDSLSGFPLTSFNIGRLEFPFILPDTPSWSGYQGTYSTGIFAPQQVLVSITEDSIKQVNQIQPHSLSKWLLEFGDLILFANVYSVDGRRLAHFDYQSDVDLINRLNSIEKGIYVVDFISSTGERLNTFKIYPM